MNHIPHPPIILLVPTAGATYWKRVDHPGPSTKKSRLPRRPQQPIPSFDRRALYERVSRLLKQTERDRNGLKAAASWCLQ
jgi:hypothetical protein